MLHIMMSLGRRLQKAATKRPRQSSALFAGDLPLGFFVDLVANKYEYWFRLFGPKH